MKRFFALTLMIIVVALLMLIGEHTQTAQTSMSAAPVGTFVEARPIKILVVVGHDDKVWGSKFMSVKEVELNRILASYLYDFLVADPAFYPVITQIDGNYIPELAEFFETQKSRIAEFRKERREGWAKEKITLSEEKDDVKHNRVTEDVADTLYGTSLWAEDRGFDVMVHVHFNDYPGRPRTSAGKYRGFSMYVPHHDLINGPQSRPIAEAIYARLIEKEVLSNLPVEKDGIIESKSLIAIGARNSLRIPAVLIEYGYIAEPRFHGAKRGEVLKDLAYQTYLGIKDHYLSFQ